MSKKVLLLLFYCLFLNGLIAQEISYEIDLSEAWKNTYHVSLNLEYKDAPDSIVLKMATWTPGSYLIREFSKHVSTYAASNQKNEELSSYKLDKNTWIVKNEGSKKVIFKYAVYAHELSVRTSFLNSDFGLINGTSIFIYPENALKNESNINLILPSGWKVSTTLESINKQNTSFQSRNFDELFDCPMLLGTHDEFEFEASGVRHRFAINGPTFYDEEKLKRDLTKIIEVQTDIFDDNPNKEYLFITITDDNGGGGLEHLNSTTMIIDHFRLAEASGYRRFLGLVAHEYFHLWNVKRIRPKNLGPFDYESENYTDLLWVMEGFTTYYGSKTMLRIGETSEEGFLNRITSSLEREFDKPGGKVQSIAESSLDAWIKYYRDDENDYNATVSYYGRGYLMAALLDMIIIDKTEGEKSLDDLMKYLYEEFHVKRNSGFEMNELINSINEISGHSFEEFFDKHIKGTEFPNLDSIMKHFGYSIEYSENKQQEWGINVENKDDHYFVRSVIFGSTSHEGGLNVGDELIAVEDFQYSDRRLSFFEQYYTPGTAVKITILRNGLLKELNVLTPNKNAQKLNIKTNSDLSEKQKSYRKKLFGLK